MSARIFLQIAGWFCLALAAMGSFSLLRAAMREFAKSKWPQTGGVMLQCEPKLAFTDRIGKTRSSYWTIEARFRYSIDGMDYESANFSNMPVKMMANGKHQADAPFPSIVALCADFKQGTQVQVRYQPGHPKRSFVFFRSPLHEWMGLIFPALAFLLSLFFFFAVRFAPK